MLTLGICASYGLHVCLLNDKEILFSYSNSEETKSDNLLAIIEQGLKSNNLSFNNIDVIAVCNGPGSFTGARVAISLVKGMFVGQEKKLVSFESFDCFGEADVVLSGFGSFVYVRQGDQKACLETKDVKNFKGVTDSENLAKIFGCELVKFDMKPIIMKKVADKEFISIEQLMPVYLRASQAEIEREKKHGGR